MYSYSRAQLLIHRVLLYYPNHIKSVVAQELGVRMHENAEIYDFVPLTMEALDVGLKHKHMISDFETRSRKSSFDRNKNKSSVSNGFHVKKSYCRAHNQYGLCTRKDCKFKDQCDICDSTAHGRNTCPVRQQQPVANKL